MSTDPTGGGPLTGAPLTGALADSSKAEYDLFDTPEHHALVERLADRLAARTRQREAGS
jgi:hypothetical protein